MKKNSKLTLVALLALSLGLASCGSTDGSSTSSSSEESSVTPVERIEIKPLPEYVIVGEEFNLEDYVVVHGGNGATDFTASVSEALAEIISVNGHVVTVLGEGEFTINIKAGAQEALVNGKSILRIKNELSKLFTAVVAAKKWACLYTEVDDEGYTVITGEKNVHASNYFINAHDSVDDEYNYVTGGLLIAADGKTYEFTADDSDGTNINVKPGAMSDFSRYFCNMPINADASKFEYVTEVEDGVTYEKLVLSNEVPAISVYQDYFSSKADELACFFFGESPETKYGANAKTNDLVVYPYETEDGFEFEFEFSFNYGGEDYLYETCFLTVDPELAVAPGVEEYIASGEVPEAIEFGEYSAMIAKVVEAKVYAFSAQYGFFDVETFELLDYNTVFSGFHPSWEPGFADAIEEGVVTADGMYSKVTQTVHYDSTSFEPLEEPVEVVRESGMINHNGKVYDLAESESEDYLFDATEIENTTDMWTDLGDKYLAGALVDDEKFVVNEREVLEDESVFLSLDGDIIVEKYGLALIYQLSQTIRLMSALYQMDEDILDYVTINVIVTKDGLNYFWGVNFGSFMAGFTFSIFDIGGEDIKFPLDLETIDFGDAEEQEPVADPE